jgi:hypothetical protein
MLPVNQDRMPRPRRRPVCGRPWSSPAVFEDRAAQRPIRNAEAHPCPLQPCPLQRGPVSLCHPTDRPRPTGLPSRTSTGHRWWGSGEHAGGKGRPVRHRFLDTVLNTQPEDSPLYQWPPRNCNRVWALAASAGSDAESRPQPIDLQESASAVHGKSRPENSHTLVLCHQLSVRD